MKRLSRSLLSVLFAVAFVLAVPATADAQDSAGTNEPAAASTSAGGSSIGRTEKIGIGLGGGPLINGVSGKFYLARQHTIQALLGVAGFYGGFGLEANYVYELELTSFSGGRLDLHGGGGLAFRTFPYFGVFEAGRLTAFGPNGVIGLGLKLADVPLEFALEWHPGFYFLTGGYSYVGVGPAGFYARGGAAFIRFYF